MNHEAKESGRGRKKEVGRNLEIVSDVDECSGEHVDKDPDDTRGVVEFFLEVGDSMFDVGFMRIED